MLRNLAKQFVFGLMPHAYGVRRAAAKQPRLFLTFDDGPHPVFTPMLLDILREFEVRATFFVVGSEVERHQDIVQRIVREGHALGNHTFNHDDFARLSAARQIQEIETMNALLARFDPNRVHLFRPPRGYLSLPLFLRLRAQKVALAMWSYDSMDYTNPSADGLCARFARAPVQNGEIVLFHDDNAITIEAMRRLLPRWRAEGYRFSTLEEVLH